MKSRLILGHGELSSIANRGSSSVEFSYKKEPGSTAEVQKYHIVWTASPISKAAYESIAQWFRKNNNYAPLGKKGMEQLSDGLAAINKVHHSNITLDQAAAIRNVVIKEKIIKNYYRMNAQINAIAKKYNNGADILQLSADYDFPPLNLLRGILIARGLSLTKIHAVFANKANPTTLFASAASAKRDLAQYKKAFRNDVESVFQQQEIAAVAAKNEDRFVAFFRAMGIRIQTQEDLVEIQIKRYGRAVATPDILFLDEVYINGARVFWIDYKDYVGTPIRFLAASNMEQSQRYVAKWGAGVLCFRKSFIEGLSFPNTLLLDTAALPIVFGEPNYVTKE